MFSGRRERRAEGGDCATVFAAAYSARAGPALVRRRAPRYTLGAAMNANLRRPAPLYAVLGLGLGLSLVQAGSGCSAGGAGGSDVGVEAPAAGGPTAPGLAGSGSLGNPDPGIIIDDSPAIAPDGTPLNVGSEVACDGLDENGNGVIDDVDKGRDGLCDCLRIGFLGDFASDAGNRTAAFEGWLEERSDVPVTHIGATQALTAELLRDLQVVVVGNLSQRANSGGFSPAEVDAVRQWIEVEAGGLMTLAGYTARESDIVPTVALLAPTGLSYDYMGRGPGVLGMGAPPVISRGIVAAEHPSLAGITAMGIYNAYPVVGDGEVLIREGNFNLAMSKTLGAGNV